MTDPADQDTLERGKQWLLARLEKRVHPLDGIDPAAARVTIDKLEGLEPGPWTAAWGSLADECAQRAEAAADRSEQRSWWWQAYQAAFIGRYPVPNHPLKARQYERARAFFARATALEDPPLEVVELPFAGQPGDGERLRFYLTKPAGKLEGPLPVAMVWAGIDTWKEEMHRAPWRADALPRLRGAAGGHAGRRRVPGAGLPATPSGSGRRSSTGSPNAPTSTPRVSRRSVAPSAATGR